MYFCKHGNQSTDMNAVDNQTEKKEILNRYHHDELYFWATHNGAELDLLVVKNGRKFGFEVKMNPAPKVTPSMRTALKDLELEKILVIHPGRHTWPLAEGIEACGFLDLPERLE